MPDAQVRESIYISRKISSVLCYEGDLGVNNADYDLATFTLYIIYIGGKTSAAKKVDTYSMNLIHTHALIFNLIVYTADVSLCLSVQSLSNQWSETVSSPRLTPRRKPQRNV